MFVLCALWTFEGVKLSGLFHVRERACSTYRLAVSRFHNGSPSLSSRDKSDGIVTPFIGLIISPYVCQNMRWNAVMVK